MIVEVAVVVVVVVVYVGSKIAFFFFTTKNAPKAFYGSAFFFVQTFGASRVFRGVFKDGAFKGPGDVATPIEKISRALDTTNILAKVGVA